MRFILTLSFIFLTKLLLGQSPIALQVSYPVYFNNSAYSNSSSEDELPVAHLCGIALLFLDTAETQEKITITSLRDPIIWFEKVGISTRVKFIVSDSNSIISINLLYANNACTVNILKNEQSIATGSITQDFGEYVIRLVGNEVVEEDIKSLIQLINDYLLHLHQKEQRIIPVSPFFDSDSLNLIIGKDYSFDTDYDLHWFDETLRNRIKNLAIKSFMAISRDESQNPIKETEETNAWVEHQVEKIPGVSNMTRGRVTTVFKMKGKRDYMFLRANQEYLMEIGYQYEKWKTSSGRLMINKFSIKNRENDDFIEMDIFDYTWNGVPMLYVDLINGVVMEDAGAWKADQFIIAIQDIFRLVKLPGETY
ncbi:MAG: hypothetical protein AAFZ15_24600 [Bacteroidota bacterium]